MTQDPLFIVALLACFGVLAILMRGILTFGKGGAENAKKANKLMQWRIGAQFVAVALILLFVALRQGG